MILNPLMNILFSPIIVLGFLWLFIQSAFDLGGELAIKYAEYLSRKG